MAAPTPPAASAMDGSNGNQAGGGNGGLDPAAGFPGGPGGLPPDHSPGDPLNGNTSAPLPIELDLSGNGIGITQLTSSNTFAAIDTDGYRHRTAWAAAGDAVLFVDPNGLNTIRDADQYIFTDWDPSAQSDMEALRNVFDTNHDGVLDAGDAAFGQFKLMVTNADGTTTVETLAQAGIASIDLTATSVTQSFADGSSIDGETTFTRADGTTGTVAAVTYAADAAGYAVQSTTTANADGSTTVDNRALNADGSLDNDTASTTSADGTTRTIRYDDNGTGVVDRTQTITDVDNGDGSRTETVSDYDGQGQLRDSTTTTTAADGDVFIRRDTTGGGVVNQTETRHTMTDGDVADTLADVSPDGTVIDSTFTQIGENGLGRDVQVDHRGAGDYDHSTVYRTTVAADGTRTETVIGIDHDQSATDTTTIVTAPDAQTRTSSIDADGDGTVDQVVVDQTIAGAGGAVTTRTTTYDGARSQVLGITATTLSADGLSKTTQVDMDGDGTFDRTTGDVTVTNPRGGQTEDVTVTSADGTLLSEVLTSRSTDGVSRNEATYDGQGHVLASDEIGVGPQGVTDENASSFGQDGTLLARTETTTSADGLTTTTRTDHAGDGTFDRVTTDQTVENGDGSATEVIGTRSANDTSLGRTVVETSADGLTIVTKVDTSGALNPDGTAVFDRITTDATSYTGDGSRIRTVTVTSGNGTVLSSVSTDTGAGRQSHSVTTDANGDGATTTFEQVSTAGDGTVTDSITDSNPDGSHVDGVVRTTSADGLHVTTRIDAAGSGTYNRTTTDDTTIADNGLRTEAVTDTGEDGTVVGETVTTTQSNGDLTTVSTDTAGDGTFDRVTTTATSHDAGGGTTVTVTDKAADGTVRDSTTTITAGNGLSSEVDHDLDGDGTADQITFSSMAYAADGDVTMSVAHAGTGGLVYDVTNTTISDDGRTTITDANYYGSNFGSTDYSTSDTQTVGSDGSRYDDLLVYDAAGTLVKETLTTTSGNGLSKTVQVDLGGAGTFDVSTTDDTVLNDDGSRTETTASSGSSGLNSRTAVTTSGNGLSKTVEADADGNGTVDTLTQDDTTLNADGSRDELYTQTNADQSLRDSTAIHTSADGKHVTIGRVLGTDGTQAETIDRGTNGTVTDALVDRDGSGAALGGETVTTSADGLVKIATYTDAGGDVVDVQNDTRVLNDDGSTTEQFSDVDAAAGVTAVFTTRTQGNGLSRHTDASFGGDLSDYAVDDYTYSIDDGSPDEGSVANDVTVSNTDGSERDERFGTVSADGLVTTSSTDENGDFNFDIAVSDTRNTDGSEVRQTTILNSDTGAQDRQDTVTISADGRTRTLASARDGDATVRYTETTVENADGTYSDKSQFVSGTLAPGWTQTRSQTLDTTGGQTVVISDYDAQGGLADQATTTTSGNGLFVQTLLDTTGDGTDDQLRTDDTVIEADGSRQENVFSALAPGVTEAGPGTMAYGRAITTSADGLTVVTATDDDGNGVSEKSETSVRGIDGSLTDTVTFYDNTTGDAVDALAPDGSTGTGLTKTTSADGLIVTTSEGDVTDTKAYVASSNGSYRWTEAEGGAGTVASASHDVDVNGIDTWTSTYIPAADFGSGPSTTTTIQISVAKEQAAVADADAIYQTALNRPMNDAEQESLIQYMDGGILDRQALAGTLTHDDTSYDLNFIQQAYGNDFGHDASATDTAAYLAELQSGDRNQTHAALVVDVAEKAVDEQAGNGLLALLPNAPQAAAGTVTLITPATAAATNTAQNYAAFTDAIGKPSGNLTPGQISQFGALVGDTGAASAPQVDFASASSSTSGQGTAVPGFFSSGSGATAKAPTGGAAGPLVVNLAGGRVHTTDLAASTVTFDDTGSGTASTTAWTTANEGFLVLDPQGRQVTDGSSMIPTFAALATYDANGDGTLTAAEAASAGVKIWVDANGDGVDQAGEVKSLSQAGIASIDLEDATAGSYDHGNVIAADASVTFSNGTTGDVADAWLAYGGALAQGATYQFGDDLVTRAADGTASELLYGSGETVDAGAAGLSKVVDAGANDVLQAGTGAVVVLSGAAGDHLVGGTGTDTLLAIGDGETVTTGTGTDTVDVSGANTTVDASRGTSSISLGGANDGVTGATAATTVDVTKGTGATIAATGSTITVEGGVGAEISGSGDKVTAAGRSTIVLDASNSTLVSDAASTVTLSGADDALTLDRGSTVTVAGTGETIGVASGRLALAGNASAAVTGNGDFATQAAGSSLTLSGMDGAVEVTGAGASTALDRGTVALDDGSSDALAGTADQVVQGRNTTLSLTGTGATLVVTGTGNASTLSDARVTIQAGANAQVTGSRDVIAAGPTGLSGTLAGDDDEVTISGTGGQLSIAGLRDAVTMDEGSLQLAAGTQATLAGTGDTVTLGDRATLAVTGDVDGVTEAGTGDVLTATGGGTVATATGSGDTLTLTGANVSAIAHGDGATVNVTGTGAAIYVDGSHDAVTFNGTNATISAKSSDSVTLVDGSTATVDGNLNTVSIGSGTGVVLKGTGDALTASGGGDFIVLSSSAETVSASSATVTLAKQIGVSVTGSDDAVGVDNGDTLTLSGNRDAVTVNGNGNTLAISGTGDTVSETGRSNDVVKLGGGSTTVTAGSASVVQAANGNLSVYGGLASSAVTTSSSGPSIALGNGNIVSNIAVPAKIDGYAANGLHSWQDIFDTMSGALKETDQYQYNASNQLMEIDRYNASHVKTEADLYDPQTSAEIGSYLYGSNGHVNEVTDLLHNHDWLSQSDGSYKDRTSGAVSKTQPTLR